MKKLFILLTVAALAASCEGPMGPPGPQGPAGSLSKKTYFLDVAKKDWIRVPATGPFQYYYYRFEDIEEMTKYVFDEGFYYAYIDYDDVENFLVSEGMGMTIYNKDSDGTLWEQNVACSFAEKEITLYVRYSDFVDRRPNDLYFRCVIFW